MIEKTDEVGEITRMRLYRDEGWSDKSMVKKTYYDFMKEISPEELYDKLVEYGIFSEKLPPIFSGREFLDYCKNERKYSFADTWYGYISYENIRNINIPRDIGIPNPMGYELLCKCLADNWSKIIDYFKEKTEEQQKIVSRIHIRKMRDTDALFEMNYKNWRIDGTPEPDIYIGKRYMVHADISKCYQSIYTHAIPWALVGREESKKNVHNEKEWYNELDHYVQNLKNGETHGILIGPHASHIIAEIILCAVDSHLTKEYQYYIRNIDDYTCFTDSRDEAEQFLMTLDRRLREFGLSLNYKKTEIQELPICVAETWINEIQNRVAMFQKNKDYVDYKEIRAYINFIIGLSSENNDNQSILYYAVKVIKDFNLTPNAKIYLVKSMVSLALLYPYLVPILDEYIFKVYAVDDESIGEYANLIFDKYMEKNTYEACSYAILYAIDSNLKINNFDLDKIIKSKDCILWLLALIYCRKNELKSEIKCLKKLAKDIVEAAKSIQSNEEIDRYWLFIYEALPYESLNDDWVSMKKAGVSFLKDKYKNRK